MNKDLRNKLEAALYATEHIVAKYPLSKDEISGLTMDGLVDLVIDTLYDMGKIIEDVRLVADVGVE